MPKRQFVLAFIVLAIGCQAGHLAFAVPHAIRRDNWTDDSIEMTVYLYPDSGLLNAEPFDAANGVVSMQWYLETGSLLIPETVEVIGQIAGPVDASLINNPGYDPYSGETLTGAAGYSSVTSYLIGGNERDAVFASFSVSFESSEPIPVLRFSLHRPTSGFAIYSGGMFAQAGSVFESGVVVEDYFRISGDNNGDWRVSQADLDLVLLNWGVSSGPLPPSWLGWQPSFPVGQDDLDAVLLNWGEGAFPSQESLSQRVPEPTSMLSFGCGIALILICSRLSAVRRVATAAERPRDEVLKEVGDYVAELLAAF